MELRADAELDATPAEVLAVLHDLTTYPAWLSIVGAAVPTDPADGEPGPAWLVDLVGKVGPFTRTKRVRMVRTARTEAEGRVRFERREHDGRTHNVWVLSASAVPATAERSRTAVRVDIFYGGGRTLPGADLLLRAEMHRAGGRLQAYVDGRRG